METLDDIESTSSQGGSPARTSATPAVELESTESDPDCGQSLRGAFAYFNRESSSWRTRQACFLAGLDEFSETWPRSGTMRNGIAYRRQPLAPITSATDSLYSPTPLASDRPCEGSVRLYRKAVLSGAMPEEEATAILGKSPFDGQGKIPPYCPTPRADGRDNCGGSNARQTAKRNGTYIGRRENPQYREWQMGFPIGFTEIPPSETPSAQSSPSGSGD